MVDKLGLNFGSSATSARTSRDFIPHTPLDLGDATAGTVQDTAITASVTTRTRTNRAVPRNEASARDLSERAHGHHDDTDRLCSRLRGASSRLDGQHFQDRRWELEGTCWTPEHVTMLFAWQKK